MSKKMMIFRLISRHYFRKCLFIGNISHLHPREKILNPIFTRSISDAIVRVKQSLTAKLNETTRNEVDAGGTNLFVGTGQYFEDEKNERVIVLSLGDDGNSRPPLMLLDTIIPRNEVDNLENELNSLPPVNSVRSGELDSIQHGPWKFGFVQKPSFSVFSTFGFCRQLQYSSLQGACLRIFGKGLYEDILVSNIEHIQVSLSPEPWEERRLQLKMKNGDVVSIVEDCLESVTSEHGLASLMISTEWMVKCAGHLCVTVRHLGGTLSLKLPSVLRADVNPWVAMRNKLWAEKINKES